MQQHSQSNIFFVSLSVILSHRSHSDVTLTGLALKLRGSGEFHCKILGFATLPDKVVWSKNGVEADTIRFLI